MSKQFINPEGVSKPLGYTHVVDTRGSRTVYFSGQVPQNLQGEIVGINDMKAQAEQVFLNLQAALTSVGASFADVVKFTIFITDISQLPAVREVRNRYINTAQPPASSAVEVSQLFRSEILLEIEAIAVIE
jgi:enamine deaminase RidA (YjgF/YER057c/UK114 family)